jgi:hypothetical protein
MLIALVNAKEPVCSAPATWNFDLLGQHEPPDVVSARRGQAQGLEQATLELYFSSSPCRPGISSVNTL